MNRFNLQRIHPKWVTAILATSVLFIAGCNPSVESSVDTDTDGDGLTDAEEARYGTSPVLADTDGDGYSDGQEIIDLSFNAATNNFKFNPLIADVPKLKVDIISAPDIDVVFSQGTTEVGTTGTSRTTEQATSVSTIDTSSNSSSIEESVSIGAEIGYEVGLGGGVSGSVSLDYTNTWSSESGFSHSKEELEENRIALEDTESFSEGSDYSETNGVLSVRIKLTNNSDISFIIKSLTLSSIVLNSAKEDGSDLIGNLTMDTPFKDFPEIPLGPGESNEAIFTLDTLTLEETKSILRDASGLIVAVSTSNIVDENDVSFTLRQTKINANTASVMVDFGGKLATEKYRIATNVDRTLAQVGAVDSLNRILKIPVELNDQGEVVAIRDIQEVVEDNAYWFLVRVRDDGVSVQATEYFPASSGKSEGYDIRDIDFKAGDFFQLVYMEDADDDGVGLREEFFAGTDPILPDTDGDTLSDGEELRGYTVTYSTADNVTVTELVTSSPIDEDSDFDGIYDNDERASDFLTWKTNPQSKDTDGDQLLDPQDPQPTTYNSLSPINWTITSVGTIIPNPSISFQLPNVVSSATTYEYKLFRQVVSVGNELTSDVCIVGTGVGCYKLLSSGSTSISVDDPLNDVDNAVGDQTYDYKFYLSINGSDDILVDQRQFTTDLDTKTITLSLVGLYATDVVDYFNPYVFENNVDWESELFWTFTLYAANSSSNLKVFSEVAESEAIKIASEDSIDLEDVMTFTIANDPSSWFRVRFTLYEKTDGSSNFNTTGDVRMDYFGPAFNQQSWQSYSGVPIVQHFGYISGYEKLLDLDFTYNFIVTD